jgi:hypothetical protein
VAHHHIEIDSLQQRAQAAPRTYDGPWAAGSNIPEHM